MEKREAKTDFGVNRIKLILDSDSIGEPLALEAATRWHAVSTQDKTDHYDLVFRALDELEHT